MYGTRVDEALDRADSGPGESSARSRVDHGGIHRRGR